MQPTIPNVQPKVRTIARKEQAISIYTGDVTFRVDLTSPE